MFANAYKGRRVFVTGHTGFKGSWLAAWLSQMGAVVGGFSDDVPTTPSHYSAMNLGAHLEADLRGDIRDRDALCEPCASSARTRSFIWPPRPWCVNPMTIRRLRLNPT